jgi:hypothetical protein
MTSPSVQDDTHDVGVSGQVDTKASEQTTGRGGVTGAAQTSHAQTKPASQSTLAPHDCPSASPAAAGGPPSVQALAHDAATATKTQRIVVM